MASLSEMMQYADYAGKVNNPLAGNLEGALTGYMAGDQDRRTLQKQQLDTALKILDIQEKVQKIQIEGRKQRLNENMMKAFGIEPMDSEDHKASVSGAWQMIGDKSAALPNTTEGKLARMANSMEWKPGWSVKGGFSLALKSKSGNSSTDRRTDLEGRREDMKWAEKMARDEEFKLRTKSMDPILSRKMKPTDVTVSPDSLMKFLPLAHAFRTGDTATYKKLLAQLGKNSQSGPDAVAGTLAQVAALQQSLQQKSNALKPSKPGNIVWPTTDETDDSDSEE